MCTSAKRRVEEALKRLADTYDRPLAQDGVDFVVRARQDEAGLALGDPDTHDGGAACKETATRQRRASAADIRLTETIDLRRHPPRRPGSRGCHGSRRSSPFIKHAARQCRKGAALIRAWTHIAVGVDVAFDVNLVAVDKDKEEALADGVLVRLALKVTLVDAVAASVAILDERHGLHAADEYV
jgi:hypothetical protein